MILPFHVFITQKINLHTHMTHARTHARTQSRTQCKAVVFSILETGAAKQVIDVKSDTKLKVLVFSHSDESDYKRFVYLWF